MSLPNINACACMGPQLGQPYCPCEMQRRGLSDGYEYAWTEADKQRLKEALQTIKEIEENQTKE
jgi:hypothetical protein